MFLGVCGFSFFLVAQWKTKKKTLSFFWFFTLFLTIILSKKPKKTLSFFLVFFKVKTKKNLGKNQKKQTWASDQTFSEKIWFFGFFGFLEVLVILYFLRFNPNQENSKYKVRTAEELAMKYPESK